MCSLFLLLLNLDHYSVDYQHLGKTWGLLTVKYNKKYNIGYWLTDSKTQILCMSMPFLFLVLW